MKPKPAPQNGSDLSPLEEHLPGLRAYIQLRMGAKLSSREAPSDVLQSVCREYVEARDRVEFPDEAAFRAWLQTTARHKILEKARHHGAQRRDAAREASAGAPEPAARDESMVLHPLDGMAADSMTPSRNAMGREQVDRLGAAMAQLSTDEQTVVRLVKLEGASHGVAAAQLGRSEEASRTLLRRALVKLSRHLEPPRDTSMPSR